MTFTSPDDDLEDMPFDEWVGAKRFLVLLGDRILLYWSPTLLAALVSGACRAGAVLNDAADPRGRGGDLRA